TIIAGIWATDTGALFFGKKFGKRKLWPAISPNKTIEGSLGGGLLGIIIVVLISYFANITSLLPLSTAILIGLVIAIGGQLGDLMESAVKRSLHVKDSGEILPGHGGMYDRFDSMIVVFPILYLVQLLSL
ncbi:MAG TPA: phosphatidate cytidylyltransferase, partial [Paenibacillaceae bacterium]|nr:phosphatidate cytidylyltransferase [Paenibacillaceae bacterium]